MSLSLSSSMCFCNYARAGCQRSPHLVLEGLRHCGTISTASQGKTHLFLMGLKTRCCRRCREDVFCLQSLVSRHHSFLEPILRARQRVRRRGPGRVTHSTNSARSGRCSRWFSREFFLALSGRPTEMDVSSTEGTCCCSEVSAMTAAGALGMTDFEVGGGDCLRVHWLQMRSLLNVSTYASRGV